MTHFGRLTCEEIKALRYSILSADLSKLERNESDRIQQINSYLTEEIAMCSSTQRICLNENELDLLDDIIDEYEINTVEDIKKIKEEAQ